MEPRFAANALHAQVFDKLQQCSFKLDPLLQVRSIMGLTFSLNSDWIARLT